MIQPGKSNPTPPQRRPDLVSTSSGRASDARDGGEISKIKKLKLSVSESRLAGPALYGLAPNLHDRHPPSSSTQPGAKKSFIPGDVKTWHRAKVLPEFWSCDWENWGRRHHKAYRRGHLSTAQMQKGWGISGHTGKCFGSVGENVLETASFGCRLGVQLRWNFPFFGVGVVEPLAYVPEDIAPASELILVFFADGVYYSYTYLRLNRFKGPFADHDDFLRRLNDDELWDSESEVDGVAYVC
ncbi:hypothetical protein DFH06DRAFT_1140834 [Mycena polygramma]|nr:hypothetical protein DFH06DRAFT_1140834 [Mycena polygramma]